MKNSATFSNGHGLAVNAEQLNNATTESFGTGDPSKWGPSHTNYFETTQSHDFAHELGKTHLAIAMLGRQVVRDESEVEPGLETTLRYITHIAMNQVPYIGTSPAHQ